MASSGDLAPTILVVEDEPLVRKLANRILTARGYRVLVAGDPNEAIQLAEAHRGGIDLLLTDVIMPGMNGPQLRERLAPGRPDMRVLYMSGFPGDALSREGLGQSVLFLPKPFSVDELVAKVEQALKSP